MCSFVVYWRIRDAEVSLPDPDPEQDGQGRGGKRHARGRRRGRIPDDILTAEAGRPPCRGCAEADAGDARHLQLRHHRRRRSSPSRVFPPQQVGRCVPRRAGGSRSTSRLLKNEAEAYASKVVPEARWRGGLACWPRGSWPPRAGRGGGNREEPTRFLKVYDEYRKAPEVTRLAALPRNDGGGVYSSTDKVTHRRGSLGSGVLPYLAAQRSAAAAERRKEGTQLSHDTQRACLDCIAAAHRARGGPASTPFGIHRAPERASHGAPSSGSPRRTIDEVGTALEDTDRGNGRVSSTSASLTSTWPPQEVPGDRPEASVRRCLRPLSHHRPAQVLSDRSTRNGTWPGVFGPILESTLRRVLGGASLSSTSSKTSARR